MTCGPGFTQIMTALADAARGHIPLVVFAGEAPINAKWYNQAIEQPPFAPPPARITSRAHSPKRMYQYVREAFHIARYERRPAVLGVPYDLQKQPLTGRAPIQAFGRRTAAPPGRIRRIRGRSPAGRQAASAKCPIIIAGRGAVASGAAGAIEALAEVPARCWRPRCRRAECSITTPIRSGSPAVLPARSRARVRRTGRSRDRGRRRASTITPSTAATCIQRPRWCRSTSAARAARRHARPATCIVKADAKAPPKRSPQSCKRGGKVNARAIARREVAERIKDEPVDAAEFSVAPGNSIRAA